MAELLIIYLLIVLYPYLREGIDQMIIDIVRLLCIPLSWIVKLIKLFKHE